MYLYCNSMYATHEHEMIKHLPHIKAFENRADPDQSALMEILHKWT